jgi:hyperosmotically inducible protein
MMTFKTSATTACALAALMALGACQRYDEGRTAGQKADTAVAKAQHSGAEVKGDMKQGASEARDSMSRAGDSATGKLKDASITTAVNAALARDAELSALHINVDTDSGRVVLKGTAPNDTARDRAASLASSVSGVLSVDNQLNVATRG